MCFKMPAAKYLNAGRAINIHRMARFIKLRHKFEVVQRDWSLRGGEQSEDRTMCAL